MFDYYKSINDIHTGYMIMFAICSLAYLVAWSVMKTLVPRHKEITDRKSAIAAINSPVPLTWGGAFSFSGPKVGRSLRKVLHVLRSDPDLPEQTASVMSSVAGAQ